MHCKGWPAFSVLRSLYIDMYTPLLPQPHFSFRVELTSPSGQRLLPRTESIPPVMRLTTGTWLVNTLGVGLGVELAERKLQIQILQAGLKYPLSLCRLC